MVKDEHEVEQLTSENELDWYLGVSVGKTLQCLEQNKGKYLRLFKLHHCVPATSAAVERCFSAAGYIASARWNTLCDSTLENMLVTRCNGDLLKN
jgi:hypothetical protein